VPPTEDEIFAKKTLDELNAEKPLADVFFDLDQQQIREDGRAALQKDAEWLKRWTSTKVMIEGHADSRGTNEYNLALGERRATATRDYLVSLGIPMERMTIVSKGEEQPFCTEENETCWQQNRRGHFIITAK
jgi:peptidoglycan-associated lipoprotein